MVMVKRSTYGEPLRLTSAQARRLAELQRSSKTNAKVARRARILELFGRGWRQCDIEEATGAGIATIGRVRRRFLEQGFDAAVFAFVPPGAPRLLAEADEAKIVALACTYPPEGRSRWTTELLAEEVVKRGYVARVGRETVRIVLKQHGLKPWREKNVVRSAPR